MENVKRLSPLKAKLVLPMLYETEYGICDHLQLSETRPLSAEEFQPAYDIQEDSLLNDLIFRYEENSIYDILHLSFFEYIELPRHVTLTLDANARFFRKKRDDKQAELLKRPPKL